MPTINETPAFSTWMRELRDRRAAARIALRIDRLALGLAGDINFVGEGVWELKIDYGPGYRVYYVQRGEEIYLLLCGGDKRTQNRDIKRAHKLAKDNP